MKRLPVTRFAWLGLLALLAACDNNHVEVNFAEPFPAGGTDVAGFPRRQQGRYRDVENPARVLVLTTNLLVRERAERQQTRGRWLDSLGLPHRAGEWLARGRRYRVQPLAADSFQLSWIERDTLFAAGPDWPGHLRRYRGWYYLSWPDYQYEGRWQVQRLALAGPRLTWQQPNPDSLRLRALSPRDLQEAREGKWLRFTIRPRSGSAVRQVGRYAGLWETTGEYKRKP